jgi:hypothetical protein
MTFWFDANIVNAKIQGTKIFTVPSSQWWAENTSGTKYPGSAPFDVATGIVLNLAVGGNWPCSITGCCTNIVSSADMYVYSVQIWK